MASQVKLSLGCIDDQRSVTGDRCAGPGLRAIGSTSSYTVFNWLTTPVRVGGSVRRSLDSPAVVCVDHLVDIGHHTDWLVEVDYVLMIHDILPGQHTTRCQ